MTQTVSGFTVPAGSDPVSSIDDTLVTFAGEVRAAITAATEIPSQTGNAGKYLKTDGTSVSWATAGGGGKILQVVQATYGTSTTIASTTQTDTGLTATITPSATTSKILVIVHQPMFVHRDSQGAAAYGKILRGSTTIVDASAGGQEIAYYYQPGSQADLQVMWSYTYLDSPASTSALTYKTQMAVNATSLNGYVKANVYSSSLILMEVGA